LAAPTARSADELADCSVGNFRRRTCEAIAGPNGGAGACKFRGNKDLSNYGQCVNKPTFVDAPQKLVLADCSDGDLRKARCEAITGPNGGAGACKFKTNNNKPNYLKCINDNTFVDNEPQTTTTVAQTSTTSRCFQGPVVQQKGRNAFRIAFEDNVPLEQCLTECTALVNCVGVSFRAGDKTRFMLNSFHPYCIKLMPFVTARTGAVETETY
jgi:hypothetical protein